MSKIRVSEIFRSVQGEGNRTGVLSIWVRLFGCNLRCPGFFRQDPTDPKNSEYQKTLIDASQYKSIFDLPVVEYGCDSLYSIDPKFKHLATDYESADVLTEELMKLTYDGQWQHSVTHNEIDLCFTGGEPMMQQETIAEVLTAVGVAGWRSRNNNFPSVIQIETNGTKPVNDCLHKVYADNNFILNWNISPKLYNVTGEKDAVVRNLIKQYNLISDVGCLKFVVNGSDATWKELDDHVKALRDVGVTFPVYVMPVGATREQQTDTAILSKIANEAIARGYHVSGRLHAVLFGNGVGT